MRKCFANSSSIALTRCEIVSLDIRRVVLLPAKNLVDDCRCAKDDSSPHFDHSSLLATFVNLGITQRRIEDPSWLLAWSSRHAVDRCRFKCTVVGYKRFDIGRQFVGGKQGWSTISSSLKFGQEGYCFWLAALMREMMHNT